MPFETERKFLVEVNSELRELVRGLPSDSIEQFYTVITDSMEIRYRQKGNNYFNTVKQGSGLTRIENEREIDENEYLDHLPNKVGIVIRKTRYKYRVDGRTIEIDDYIEPIIPNFLVCEVEFETEDEAHEFVIEQFLPPSVTKITDVTGNRNFENREIARRGTFTTD